LLLKIDRIGSRRERGGRKTPRTKNVFINPAGDILSCLHGVQLREESERVTIVVFHPEKSFTSFCRNEENNSLNSPMEGGG